MRRVAWILVLVLSCLGRRASAAGVESCGTSVNDSTLATTGTQGLTFTPFRFGLYRTDLTARDLEILWDTLYGTMTSDATATLEKFVTSFVQTLGSNPTAADARNIEAVYNTLRRAGLNWSSSDPADSLALHVGRLDPSNSVVEDT